MADNTETETPVLEVEESSSSMIGGVMGIVIGSVLTLMIFLYFVLIGLTKGVDGMKTKLFISLAIFFILPALLSMVIGPGAAVVPLVFMVYCWVTKTQFLSCRGYNQSTSPTPPSSLSSQPCATLAIFSWSMISWVGVGRG